MKEIIFSKLRHLVICIITSENYHRRLEHYNGNKRNIFPPRRKTPNHGYYVLAVVTIYDVITYIVTIRSSVLLPHNELTCTVTRNLSEKIIGCTRNKNILFMHVKKSSHTPMVGAPRARSVPLWLIPPPTSSLPRCVSVFYPNRPERYYDVCGACLLYISDRGLHFTTPQPAAVIIYDVSVAFFFFLTRRVRGNRWFTTLRRR